MSNFEFDMSGLEIGLQEIKGRIKNACKLGIQDSMDDLKRISTEIAPIDTSNLRRSAKTRVTEQVTKTVGEITFHAVEMTSSGRFNYGLWIHEGEYNLGPLSAAAPGTDGYEVGNKYLERPLYGESEKYKRWIDQEVKDVLR
jgi:hypothetical protein